MFKVFAKNPATCHKQCPMRKPWIIFIAIGLAVFTGSIISTHSWIYPVLEVGGTLFIQALTLVVVPLVIASIITGVSRIASDEEFGIVGRKTFSFFILFNLIGIMIGVFLANVAQPGVGIQLPSNLPVQIVPVEGGSAIANFILNIVPSNILDAFAKGKMLALIFFSMLFGYALTQISTKAFQFHRRFWRGIFEGTINIVHGIMFFLPIGVFCLVAKVIAEMGLETLRPLGHFIWICIVGFALFAFGAVPLILKFVGRVNLRRYYKSLYPALLTAFSTSSSTATLPVALECLEERAGVSNRICSLVVPLGTSINLSATALYNALGGLFIAQVFGVEMTAASQILLVIVSLFISFGVASVPGGGLIANLTLLKTMGLPLEGMALFIALDRILDMFRTSTNLFSYTASTILVAKGTGEERILKRDWYRI